MTLRLAADIGGTFTDIVCLDDDTATCLATKVPTTPDDIAIGVIQGFDEITGGDYSLVGSVVYGTTAGLNAVLQRAGARTALITTRGFRDVYEVGRGNHPDMYDNQYRKPEPLLPRSAVFEVDERLDSSGASRTSVDHEQVRAIARQLDGFEAVAIALLHSYTNPAHEDEIASILRGELPESVAITTSSAIAPELGEYERVSTTVLNAYMAPPIRRYVTRLRALLTERGYLGDLFVMQSNGGMLTEALAASQPVRVVMSGPVGGVIGARAVGSWLGESDVLAVDMGGTSFDVSLLVDGNPELALEYQLEGFPVLSPSVNTLSVGAGGGSIAWVEAGGMRVGPRSSGAVPGPASYDRGGVEPTTTDANVVLGRIAPERFLGGRMAIRTDLAIDAVASYGAEHGLEVAETAEGILTISNATMSDAIRQITLRRGLDPRDFALVAYGGAGPLHAVDLADELDIDHVIVPPTPGAFSAWGMLHAELSTDGVAALLIDLADLEETALQERFASIKAGLDAELAGLIEASGRAVVRRSLDLRYSGQKYTVNIAIDSVPLSDLRSRFDEIYRTLYGFASPDTPVEVVNARLALVAEREPASPFSYGVEATTAGNSTLTGKYHGVDVTTVVVERDSLGSGQVLDGPAIISELTSTTYLPPEWRATVTPDGSLSIRRTTGARA